MKKEILYTYLGTNGTITSPVHLEDIYYTRQYRLTAEDGFVLTKDDKKFYKQIMIAENDLGDWKEIEEV